MVIDIMCLETYILKLNFKMFRNKFIVFLFSSFSLAQMSVSDITRMGNNQLDAIREELKNTQLNNSTDTEQLSDVNQISEKESIEGLLILDDSYDDLFGYKYFQRDINFFDNIPAPQDFRVGPGDELIISLWGETNLRDTFTINKEGFIFYENVGFINLSNKTIDEAEKHLISKLSEIYSTLSDSSSKTELMIEIGKIRSLNIYFTGEVFEPGIHLIHPFSDVFMSLAKAGGVKKTGSLRKVEILRGGELLDTIDFYQLFNQGENNFTNIRLIDGDVINVPVVKKKISISGEVNRPMTYELKDKESLEDLISYAAGLTPLSSNNIFVKSVIPISERSSDDNAFSSYNVKLIDSKSTFLNNGDSVKVIGVGEVESTLSIFGRVKNPGEYSAVNSTLKDILDIAGGFDDPIFRKTINDEIVVLRKNENSFYGEEIIVSYNESSSLTLLPGDKIFVYEDINYKNSFTFRIEGEVNKPGTFPLRGDITLSEALKVAGGITENGSLKTVSIFQEFTSIDDDGVVTVTQSPVGNVKSNFILSANSVVKVLPFESVIRVEGNVYAPGLIAINDNSVTMSRAIELAGGRKPYTLKKSSYVLRANGEIDKSNFFRGRLKRVYPGDTVVVPVDPDPDSFDITTFVADLSTTLANIAAILIVIDNNN